MASTDEDFGRSTIGAELPETVGDTTADIPVRGGTVRGGTVLDGMVLGGTVLGDAVPGDAVLGPAMPAMVVGVTAVRTPESEAAALPA